MSLSFVVSKVLPKEKIFWLRKSQVGDTRHPEESFIEAEEIIRKKAANSIDLWMAHMDEEMHYILNLPL